MDAVFRGHFRHGALALYGLERNAGLEARVMVPAFRQVPISSFLKTSRRQSLAYITVRFSGRCSKERPCPARVIYLLSRHDPVLTLSLHG